jgi:hypothetical protein
MKREKPKEPFTAYDYHRFYTHPTTDKTCPKYLNSLLSDLSMLISHKWAMSDTLHMLSHPEREKPLTQAGECIKLMQLKQKEEENKRKLYAEAYNELMEEINRLDEF